jgi:phage recombination protein Bet
MAVTNKITGTKQPEKAQQQKAEITYESGGETVNLSPQLIRRYLVRGGGEVTDEEVSAFLFLCRFQHLNPFINEAYLIKYGSTSAATIVVGKDVFIKRARAEKDFRGFTAGIIIRDKESGDVIEREGAFWLKGQEELVGGWAKVIVDSFPSPFYAAVALEDYIGRKKNGEINGQWQSKPATMIRKVALAQALRDAFPNMSGMYAAEERAITEPDDFMSRDAEIVIPEDAPAAQKAQQYQPPVNAPAEIIVDMPPAQDTEIPPRAQQNGQRPNAAVDDPEAALFGG